MARQFINTKTLQQDLIAGLVLGVQSIPDGLAQGFLAFVNPIYGLYGYLMGTFTGAFFTSSAFMVVQATGAMSLVVASVPQIHHPAYGDGALFTLSLLTGVVMLILGLFKLGSLIRFVPHAVMTGFVNAVALLIILGQLNDLTGHNPGGSNRITQTINHLLNLNQVDLPTLMVGLATIFLIIMLEKTRLKALGMVVAIILTSLLVPLFGWESVEQLNDIAEVPGSLPRPVIPQLSLIPSLIIPALSLAFVGLVQGASITKSYVNPDGKYPDASGDFVGQGVANLASGLFQGMPVGGSFSATSLVTSAGARSRFAMIFAGIVMAVAIVLFGSAIGYIAMPAMAGLLILIGFRTFRPEQVNMVWQTGTIQRVVMGITFVSCLLIPLQFAVIIGVVMSVLLFVFQQSNKITVKEWKATDSPYPIEQDPPAALPSDEVIVLIPYGSLFFAAAPLFEQQLPEVTRETHSTVVIINLRGYEELGSTFLNVLEKYTGELQRHSSKLMLAGVGPHIFSQLEHTGLIRQMGRSNVIAATEQLGQSLFEAWEDAETWIIEQQKSEPLAPDQPASEPGSQGKVI